MHIPLLPQYSLIRIARFVKFLFVKYNNIYFLRIVTPERQSCKLQVPKSGTNVKSLDYLLSTERIIESGLPRNCKVINTTYLFW